MAEKELFGNSEQLDATEQQKSTEQSSAKDTNVPITDTISRQAAIDAFKKELTVGESKGNYVTICSAIGYEGAKQILESLPSAQQERKKGKWTYNSPVTMKCNQCGFVIKDWDWHRFKYCPNCIADMRGEDDE